jgi:hypothetical protein
MKTLQEQYNLLKEGKGHKGTFMKEAKRLFPNIVPNSATYNQTAKLLKQRSVISENVFPIMPASGLNPFTTFDKFVNEDVKATEKKTTKEITQAETAGYDYKDTKNLNNQIFDQYLNGLRFEMEQNPKLLAYHPTEALEEAKEIVTKNLEKDPLYYMKNAAFGIKDLGYTELKNQIESTGKYKSSGYGDIKENKMKELNAFKNFLNKDLEKKEEIIQETTTSSDLKDLLEEAVAGIPSLGNPFLERKKEKYENTFESFLNEEKEEMEEEMEEMEEGEAAYEYEKGKDAGKKMKKEEMKPKKEGKMKPENFIKEVEKLSKRAANEVAVKAYEGKMNSLKETLSTINEDENLAEFIDEAKTAAVQNEIALYEKYCNKAMQELDYSKNNK